MLRLENLSPVASQSFERQLGPEVRAACNGVNRGREKGGVVLVPHQADLPNRLQNGARGHGDDGNLRAIASTSGTKKPSCSLVVMKTAAA
jgi:hypothetical protein